jgi:hypothetical protein
MLTGRKPTRREAGKQLLSWSLSRLSLVAGLGLCLWAVNYGMS